VLRLFPDEVGILIGPSRLLLVKMHLGLKPKCLLEQSLTVPGGSASNWTPALEALGQELADGKWQKARARVVVSDQFVRYEVLPWSIELSKENERLAHARYLLSSTYGDLVEQWTVALSDAAPGASRLVSAMPASLIDDIETVTTASGLTLASLQPQLVVTYNLWRHRLPRAAAWFATIDEGSLVAMHLRDGHCDRVRAVRISEDWGIELKRIQTMGRLAQSRPAEGPVFVDAPMCVRMMANEQREAVEWLEGEAQPTGTLARLAALREAAA
jgi:hypothetical protein